MYKYQNITKMLGYTEDQIFSVEDSYIEPWFDGGGLKISISLNDKNREIPIHFISEEKVSELLLTNRNNALDMLDGIDVDDIEIPEWKVGDMCYFEYKINYISSMTNNRITGCSDEYGGTSGFDLGNRCIKISPWSMKCSNSVNFYYTWLNEIENSISEHLINYPDIMETLIDLWINYYNREIDAEIKLTEYGQFIIDTVQNNKFDTKYTHTHNNGDVVNYPIFKSRGTVCVIGDAGISGEGGISGEAGDTGVIGTVGLADLT